MQLTSVRPYRGTVYTPLRYPGGKTRLAGFLEHVLDRPHWRRGTSDSRSRAAGCHRSLSILRRGQ